ncbi:hypothetical protein AMATHDRAFT_151840 [Amanita thiersii Skay4041]|uniref:PAN2-PAN3 deadenylation complex subunit PAN3 n=1 Tax=Amanita thiersii Skay4041 TaxID=703135 RepID=A0A2A9NIL3_9AGAR|nr:hypothetical protein AMATHDRAFT_151840 [Amanita thiersii Skay4041]
MSFFSRPHSTPVKIATPNTQDELKSHRKDSVQRQCRNIMIYGYCKFQDKGCIYYHPPTASRLLMPSLSAQAINAPIFVPKTITSALSYPTHDGYDSYTYNGADVSVSSEALDAIQYYDETQYNPYQHDYATTTLDPSYAYPSAPVFLRQPLNYHLYTPAMPVPFALSTSELHFVPASHDLRQMLQQRSEVTRGVAPIELPQELQGYHTLAPMENINATPNERRKFLNWYSVVYRAIRTSDGIPYALRRIENFRLTQQSAFAAIEAWSRIRHPGIVSVHEAFTTKSFNDSSLVVCYSYHANARTLFDLHLRSKVAAFQQQVPSQASQRQVAAGYAPGPFGSVGSTTAASASQQHQMVAERVVWSYVVQIASAIKAVHDAGMAVRMVDATKILVTSQNRVRIGSCGLIDVLMHDTPQNMALQQQEDLTMFGRLLFALCCQSFVVSNGPGFQKSLDTIGRQYSPELKNAILFLMSKATPHRVSTIDQFLDMIAGKVVNEMNDALLATDRLENELLSELENARLVRLLCKFGFINERPEFAREPRWSETGDRYIVKLFRDYVFHQVDEHGSPVINLSHVLTCLNKLDAGTDEKIMLVARDEQSCLVVSYKDIKRCVETTFLCVLAFPFPRHTIYKLNVLIV